MRISKARNLSGICAKDNNRPALMNPYFDGKKIICTDGKAMIRFNPENFEGDTPGIVPLSVVKLAGAEKNISLKETARAEIKDGTFIDSVRDVVTFPEVEKFIPEDIPGSIRLAINAKLLYNLCQANSTPASKDSKNIVVLTIPLDPIDALKGIKVKFLEAKDDEGLIMPCRLPEE